MPLTGELARLVFRPDSEEYTDGTVDSYDETPPGEMPPGVRFERQLSVLAEPQPFINDYVNRINYARFIEIAGQIARRLEHAQAEAEQEDYPVWLGDLVKSLHRSMTPVITFNYDTLLEAAANSVLRAEGIIPEFPRRRNRLHACRRHEVSPPGFEESEFDFSHVARHETNCEKIVIVNPQPEGVERTLRELGITAEIEGVKSVEDWVPRFTNGCYGAVD